MSDFTWPAGIPYQPLNESLAQTPAQPYLRSDFEQGMPRQRRLFRNAPTTFDMQWAFTQEEFRIWKGFRNAVGNGTFLIPVFIDTDYQTVRAQIDPASIKQTRSGGEWLVSATIMTMDSVSPTISEYAIEMLMLGYGGTLEDLVDLFEQSVQVDYAAAFA